MAWSEVLNRRTRTGKHWYDDQTGIRKYEERLGTYIHYPTSGPDSVVYDGVVDLSPNRVDNVQFDGWSVTQNNWHYALGRDLANHGTEDGWVGFGGRQGAHWFKFRLVRSGYLRWSDRTWADLGGAPTYNRTNLSQTTEQLAMGPSGTEATVNAVTSATWQDLWPVIPEGQIDITWQAEGRQLKEEVKVTQAAREWIAANRPPSYYFPGTPASDVLFGFVFRLDWSDIPNVYKGGVLQDRDSDFTSDDTKIFLRDAVDRLLAFMPVDDLIVKSAGEEVGRLKLKKRFYKDVDGNHYLAVGVFADDLAQLPSGDLIFDPTLSQQPDETAGVDTYVREGNPTNTYETATTLILVGTASIRVSAFLKFDLSSLSGYNVVQAVYTTYVSTDRAATKAEKVNRILSANSSWVEACSWDYAVPSSTRWAGDTGSDGGTDAGCSVSGTDYSATALWSGTVPASVGVDNPVARTLNLTEVNSMVSNNYGFAHIENDTATGYNYHSSSASTAGLRPKLVLDYTQLKFVVRTSGTSLANHGLDPISTASFTPADDSLLLVFLGVVDNGGGDIASELTVTDSLGTPLTYTARITNGRTGGYNAQGVCWTAPVTTGASMTLTFDCYGNSIYSYGWYVIEVTGYEKTTPVNGTATSNSEVSDGAISTTLSVAPANEDLVFGFLWLDGDSTGTIGVTPGSTFTEISEIGGTGPYAYGQAQYRAWSTSTTADWVDIKTGTMNTYSHQSMSIVIKVRTGPTGSLSQTLGSLTGTLTGTVDVVGTLSETLGSLTVSATATAADTPFGTIIQQVVPDPPGDSGSGGSEITANISAPLSGNLILVVHFTGDSNSIGPSGYTEALAMTDTPNADQGAIYYKISNGTETSVTCTSDAFDEQMMVVFDIKGPFATSPLDQTATAGPTDGSSGSISIGPTGTTATADEFAVAAATARSITDFNNWSNSFTWRATTKSQYKGLHVGTKLLSTPQTVSTTATLYANAVMMGGIATFAKASTLIVPTGIASGEAFGTAAISTGSLSVAPSGIASGEAFGTAEISTGSVSVVPSGIASGEAFGTAEISIGSVSVAPSGIASGEAFGTSVISTGSVSVAPSGIASGEAFGTSVISTGSVSVVPSGIASGEAFGTAVITALAPPQLARPDADVSLGGWTNELGQTTNLYESINETSPSDTDYVKTEMTPTPDTLEVSIGNLLDPGVHTSHFVRYRYRCDTAATAARLTVSLVQGTTVIASWAHTSISDTWADAEQTLSSGEAAAITDYADLRLRFVVDEVV